MTVRFAPHAQNFVKDIIFHPCARPFYVYVETVLPAFAELFITVAILDFSDLIRMRAKDIATRPPRTGRGRSHLRKGKPIPGKKPQVERYVQKGVRTLLIVTEPLEKIGFLILLYFAADRFFYRWQSLLEAAPYCEGPGLLLTRSRSGGNVPILPGGAATPLPSVDQAHNIIPDDGFGQGLDVGPYRVVFALTVTGPPGGLTGVHLRIAKIGGFPLGNIDGEPVDIAEGQEVDLMVVAAFTVPPFGSASIGWELVGPAVPAGIASRRGQIVIQSTIG